MDGDPGDQPHVFEVDRRKRSRNLRWAQAQQIGGLLQPGNGHVIALASQDLADLPLDRYVDVLVESPHQGILGVPERLPCRRTKSAASRMAFGTEGSKVAGSVRRIHSW